MHYFISAGEPSGDLHASELMLALKALDAEARFTFLGGDLMVKAAGHAPVIDYRRMAFMGFSEVLRNMRTIAGNFSIARRSMLEASPDALILVDYPSFNLKLAKFAKERLGIPVYYFIAPKVWAWKEWRVKQIRRYVDKVLSILPFEEEYFRNHGIEAIYVGNPSKEEVDRRLSDSGSRDEFLRRHGLHADRPILALVPGSRRGELRNNLPVMDMVARYHLSELQPVIAAAPGMDAKEYTLYSDLPRVAEDTFRLMHFATVALVTSGTATLECALAGTPQVVCYRSNGSKLAYGIMRRVLKIPYVSLPNLIANREIIPEMLLHHCNVSEVDERLDDILPGTPGYYAQLDGYALMRRRLGDNAAADTSASIIISNLKG